MEVTEMPTSNCKAYYGLKIGFKTKKQALNFKFEQIH